MTAVTRLKNRWHFNNAMLEIESAIADDLNDFTAMLRGGAALAATVDNLNNGRFETFVDRLQLPMYYPGVQGVGYARKVTEDQVSRVEENMRKDGSTNFTIYPAGARPVMFPILFLQPLDRRNQRALGYDMFSEPVRRAAMMVAATNGPTLSGKVTLVQEIDSQKQSGFLLYVAVFGPGKVPEAPEVRQTALRGFIYSPFRAGDFFNSVFRESRASHLHFTIYDGAQQNQAALLYESTNAASASPWITTNRTVHLANHDWTIVFKTTPAFEQILGGKTAVLVPITGASVSFIIFAFTFYFVRQHEELLRRGLALRESEELHRAISETATDGIILIDEHSRIISVNRSVQRIFGYSRDELLGNELTALMPEQMRERHRQGLSRYLTSGEHHIPWTGVELPGRHKDGHQIALEISFAEIGSKGKRIFTGTVRDISERKKAREHIEQLNRDLEKRVTERTAELQETNTQLESFIYSVAHDLRTPLRSMRGFAEILLEDFGKPLEGAGQNYIDRIIRSAGEMDELIKDLLDYSQISRAKIALAPVDLNQLLTELHEQFAHEIEQKDGDLSIESPLPMVIGYEPTLRQAFVNLISNALKFVKPGEKPSVRVRVEAAANNCARIWVEDHGVGISPQHHERIFGVFEQLDPQAYGGTGIGLAIVRRAIERMGGKVGVESELGKGSRFFVELRKA